MNKHHSTVVVSEPVEITETLAEAIRTAIENIRSAGLDAARVEVDATAVGPSA
jgi:hypothetical protein